MPEVLGRLRPPRLTSPPASPAGGEEYYDTGLNQLLYWNGTTWVAGGSGGSGGTTIVNAAPVPQNTAAKVYRGNSWTIQANNITKVPVDTIAYDLGGNFQTANNRYICPTTGIYAVYGELDIYAGSAAQRFYLSVYKNNVEVSRGTDVTWRNASTGDAIPAVVADQIQCNAGDYLELNVYAGPGSNAQTQGIGTYENYLSVSKVDVAGAWGANPLNTAARAYRNAAFTTVVSTYSKVPVDTASYDAGGNLQLANGRYVCPATGYYHVTGEINLTSTAAGQECVAVLAKNGGLVTQGTSSYSAAAGQAVDAQAADTIQCNAGDYLELWYYASAALAIAIAPYCNFLSVSRVDMVGSGGPGFSMNTAARAYRAAAFSLPGVTITKIPLDTASFDTGGNLQIASSRYVCPVAGYYQVDGEWLASSPVVGTIECYAGIYKNGVRASLGAPVQQSGLQVGSDIGAAVSDVVQCNAGDYLELWAWQASGSAANLANNPAYNYLSVVKVDVGGTPGSGWKQYTGVGTPSIAAVPGNTGDWCVRTGDGEVFQQVGGAWVDQGWSLQGAQAPYFCFVWRTGAHNGSNAGTGYVNLASDTVNADPNNSYSIPAQNYTCPVAGRYRVKGQCRYSAISSYAAISIFYNGSLTLEGAVQGAAGGVTVDGTVTCNAGDKLAVCVYHGSTASALNAPSIGDNWMQVEFVAPTGNQQQPIQAASQARAYRTAALSVAGSGTFTKIPVDTASYDAGNNFQVANGRYVCPVGGYYQVNGEVATSTSIAGFAAIYKNGVLASEGVFSTGYSTAVSDVIQCNPGDYLELWYLNSSAGSASVSVGLTGQTYLSVSLVGTQPTAAPANAARAHRTAALTPAAATWTKIPLDTIDTDPGGNVSVANGRYVCPVAGIYDVLGSVEFNISSTPGYTTMGIAIYKNGAAYSWDVQTPAVQTSATVGIADKVQCNAGDYLELWCYCAQSVPISASAQYNWLAVSLLTAAPAPLPVTVPQVVTAGLPSSPVDGQECYYVADAANGVVWHLKYRAADPSAHKWQFVGGPELLSGPAGSVVCTSTTYVPLTSGPSITLPIAGDYQIEFGSRWASGGSSSSAQALASLAVGGANVGTAAIASYFFTAAGQQAGGQLALAEALAGQAAGAVVTLNVGGGTSSPSVTLSNGWIKVRPVRLG